MNTELQNKFKKFLGACNDANTAMMRCLKAEVSDSRTCKVIFSMYLDLKNTFC